ncbi:MAG TPA: right-handed parallel beta-helix repeat-containing protein, partial [Pyrinomonadaceae bacterium]|nr:right-handed parallel beta-helix repeat-containing protein [Pyrinomonadaceae bacterium]
MKKISIRIFALAVIAFGCSMLANAQATRTWVSGVGDDVNPCSRTAPCKTFAGAISKTATNGEINCLDPAGYGAVTITKSITIDCEDTQGSILSSGTNGIVINITAATDTKKAVKIRGISINGAGTGLNGIRVLTVNTLIVEDGVIDGVTTHGISVETTGGTPKILVDRMSIRSNNGNGINAFIIGGSLNLSVSNSVLSNNNGGFNLSSNTKAVISSSKIVNNTTGLASASADLNIFGCTISGNTTGISSTASSNVRISGNMITANNTGLSAVGGNIISFGNNSIFGNIA